MSGTPGERRFTVPQAESPNVNARLVLASASPQRHKILRDAGFTFEIADPGEVEAELDSAPTPEALAIGKAQLKARAVARRLQPPYPAIVIGCDTLVAYGAEVIGKPLDRPDAIGILTRLAGSRHRCISGLCLWPVRQGAGPGALPAEAPLVAADTTWIQMRPMSAAEIENYVASGESDGKAGAYAIQEEGDKFIASLKGSFLNVVGFPLEMFQQLLPRVLRDLS